MKEVILLVGNIGTGKTTWANKFLRDHQNTHGIVSMDSIVTAIEGRYTYRYEKMKVYKKVEDAMIRSLLASGISVIIDRTNMTPEIRAKYIKIIPKGTKVTCVDFGRGDNGSLSRRSNDSKGISSGQWQVIHEEFKDQYVRPSEAEGFANIIRMRGGK